MCLALLLATEMGGFEWPVTAPSQTFSRYSSNPAIPFVLTTFVDGLRNRESAPLIAKAPNTARGCLLHQGKSTWQDGTAQTKGATSDHPEDNVCAVQ